MNPLIKLIILIAGLTLSIGGLDVLTDDYTSNNILTTMSMGLFGVLLFLGGILAIVSSGAIDFLDKDIKDRLISTTKPTPIDYEAELQRLARVNIRLRQTIEEKDAIIEGTKQTTTSYNDELNSFIRVKNNYKTTIDVKEAEILKLKAEIAKLTSKADKGAPFDEPFPVPVPDDIVKKDEIEHSRSY